MAKIKKQKGQSRRSLMKLAWKHFSAHVRKKDANFAGYVACCCCGQMHLWNSGLIHAGHWIHDKLDFDERNVHPQCRNCNYKFNKNTNTFYAIYMAQRYGYEEMEELRELASRKGNDYTVIELQAVIDKYK